jgi:hypothetical protein
MCNTDDEVGNKESGKLSGWVCYPQQVPPTRYSIYLCRLQYYHVYMWLYAGFGLYIGFTDHLQAVTLNNYKIVTELHTPNISVTTVHVKFSQSRHFLITGFNSGDSTTSTDNWLFASDSHAELTKLRLRVTLLLAVYRPSVLATSPWGSRRVFFQLNTWSHNPCVISSLTRGWVCLLQLLLALASAVILRSESRGTHNHILLFQIRDFPSLEGQVPVFISPSNRVAQLSLSDTRCCGNMFT